MKNKFTTGQVLRHIKSQSIWLVVDVSTAPEHQHLEGEKTVTVVGNCLYTGRVIDCEYWKPGCNDTWFVDIDNDRQAKYFSDQWEIIARA